MAVNLEHKQLLEIVSYDPEIGIFTWLIKANRGKSRVGEIAGSQAGNGYMQIKINNQVYAQHRLAFLYVNGRMPADEIDHINGDIQDNRICNLREASSSINKENRRRPKSNSASGILGASLDKRRGGYTSQILIAGVNRYLGSFDTAEDAHEAYVAAKRVHHAGCTL